MSICKIMHTVTSQGSLCSFSYKRLVLVHIHFRRFFFPYDHGTVYIRLARQRRRPRLNGTRVGDGDFGLRGPGSGSPILDGFDEVQALNDLTLNTRGSASMTAPIPAGERWLTEDDVSTIEP